MFGIGPMEIVVILLVALLFVGPQRLPELAKQLGRFFVHAKRMTSDVRGTIDGYMKEAEAEILAEERQKIKKLIESEIKDVEAIRDETRQAIEDKPSASDHDAPDSPDHAISNDEDVWVSHRERLDDDSDQADTVGGVKPEGSS